LPVYAVSTQNGTLGYPSATMPDDNEGTPPGPAAGGEPPFESETSAGRASGPSSDPEHAPDVEEKDTWVTRALEWVEVVGNKLPDPAMLFLIALILTWIASWLLGGFDFTDLHPRPEGRLIVQNQLTGPALAAFLAGMVHTFVTFHPLGVVLVALLGVGVAEHTGFVHAGLKYVLSFTSRSLLTPTLILVACMSHTAADAGYVLVIPLGGIIFYAAGRHPLAGIAAAFAGVSGGFSANFIPSSLDPLLQGLTQEGAQLLDPALQVNPLCNWWFTSFSTALVVLLGWYLTDRIIEPRLEDTPVELEEGDEIPKMDALTPAERWGVRAGLLTVLVCIAILVLVTWPAESPLRAENGQLTGRGAPLMDSIVPLIFLFFVFPGIVYGYVSGTVRSHRDIIEGMSRAMKTMGYYIVMAFFAALFIQALIDSRMGELLALQGAVFLKTLGLPAWVTIVGVILLTAVINLLVGSASAKWALLSPIFVPMLMQLGISPELTQAAYRVGDSTTNIITPLMPYFPLIVVFCQRYYRRTGIGTLLSLMLPYSLVFLAVWTVFLLVYWGLGIPLGLQAPYVYP
jgi:aminobenzoyl-glutamate transport protein